jgi:uncharacterized membrane protein
VSLVVALALYIAVTYLLRVFGVFAPAVVSRLDKWAEPLTAAVLVSLVVSGTFASQQALLIDARLVGLGVAVVAAALRAPLLVTLLAAVASTAAVRALT